MVRHGPCISAHILTAWSAAIANAEVATVGDVELVPLPRFAAWRHVSARDGFEVMFTDHVRGGSQIRGETAAVENDAAWSVGYMIQTGADWRTRRLEARLRGLAGDSTLVLEQVADGRWVIDGRPAPRLDGCADVDLESSAVTNTLPVHRIAMREGVSYQVPAGFVRAEDLRVDRLEQTYELISSTSEGLVVAYSSPTFDFACTLRYDATGLVLDYPGLAIRHR